VQEPDSCFSAVDMQSSKRPQRRKLELRASCSEAITLCFDVSLKATTETRFLWFFPGLGCEWKVDLVTELMAKEKELGIHPDPDLDYFLKVVTLT
jgi:hypothetical protein